MRALKVLSLNLVLTFLECGLFGPGIPKLTGYGLVAWAARTPFYLLPLYIGAAMVLWQDLSESYLRSALVGVALTIPSGLWVIAARCPWYEALAHVTIGLTQGLVLAWVARTMPARERNVVAKAV